MQRFSLPTVKFSIGICKSQAKVAEYVSPPRSKVPTPLDIEIDTAKLIKVEQANNKKVEPVAVSELAGMTAKQLDDHLASLRDSVKRLQLMECSFVAENTDV